MSRTTITGVKGSPLPDLEAMGLARKMKPLTSLIREQDRLRRRAEELGGEQERLKAEIKRLEEDRTAEWGRRIRADEEAPSDEPIERAKRRLEDVRRERAAVRHAADLAEAELKQTVAEHAAQWDRLVQERGEKILAEAQEIAEALSRKLAETEGLVGLHSWLTSGGQNYTAPTPATVSIDALLHERRRELGLLEVGGVIG
jgi:predicted  nucleic acid-binding Zn-ribbon protein